MRIWLNQLIPKTSVNNANTAKSLDKDEIIWYCDFGWDHGCVIPPFVWWMCASCEKTGVIACFFVYKPLVSIRGLCYSGHMGDTTEYERSQERENSRWATTYHGVLEKSVLVVKSLAVKNLILSQAREKATHTYFRVAHNLPVKRSYSLWPFFSQRKDPREIPGVFSFYKKIGEHFCSPCVSDNIFKS